METIGIANTASVTYGYSATDANANFCLTATVGEISYYLNNSTKTSPTEGGCNGHVWPGGVVMTNLVTNGDFSQGTSGWSSENANTFAIVNGKIRLTGPTYAVIRILQFHALTQGHAYYVRVSGLARQSTSMSDYQFQYYDLPLSKAVFTTNTVPAMTTESSYVFTVSTSVSPTTRFTVIGNGMTVGSPDYIEFGTASVIDLTATFGAGKEPTKAQMDQIMQQFPNGWFDGTVTANTKGVL